MSIIGKLIVVLPIILLVLGVLIGHIHLGRALLSGSAVFVAGFLIFFLTMPAALHDPQFAISGFFTGFALMSMSAWAGVIVGWLFSTPNPRPPVVLAAETYQGLDPATQEKVWRLGRLAFKLGAKHLSQHLRDKGHARSADALRDGSRLI